MAIKQGWSFGKEHGFTGSAGQTMVKGYARGGGVKPLPGCAKGGRPPMHLHLKKGALHKELGIKQGQKIPEARLQAAKHSSSPLERKRATFAENAKHWQHKAKGGTVEGGAEAGKGKLGPDLNLHFPGNHLAYKKGGQVKFEREDSEPNESAKGESHRDKADSLSERYEARRGGKVQHKSKGGSMHDDARGGPVYKARGGEMRPPGMPRAPVLGMKRTRHPPGMPGGMGKPMPQVPGLPAAGAAPMGVPGAPGSPPRVMSRGGKSRC